MTAKKKQKQSLFSQFPTEQIFEYWNQCNSLRELANQLGIFESLSRIDYEFIEAIKTRKVWQKQILLANWKAENLRYSYVTKLLPEELQSTMNLPGIETLGHLSLHYILSPKHGRKLMRECILKIELDVKKELHKGVYGVSATPLHWPTRFYEKKIEAKPTICPICLFQSTNPKQIELHHLPSVETGPKNNRTSEYYRTKDLQPMCANCHSLEHRTGEHLQKICGKWHKKIPGNQKYINPSEIFSRNCSETYRVQKNYYLKWYLKESSQYICENCGICWWGKEKKILTLELHHKDQNQSNSLISNLQLLCTNCHRNY